jgi:hypothetical protein
LDQQFGQLIEAAVDVADDVERTVVLLAIVPERLALDLRHLVDQPLASARLRVEAQAMHVPESLAIQVSQRSAHLNNLVANDVAAKIPVGAAFIAFVADAIGHIQHNRHGQHIMLPRQLHQRLARLRLHVRRVNHRKQPARQPLGGHVFQHVKRVPGRLLAVLVIADQPPAKVR